MNYLSLTIAMCAAVTWSICVVYELIHPYKIAEAVPLHDLPNLDYPLPPAALLDGEGVECRLFENGGVVPPHPVPVQPGKLMG